jgi:hypothetical protein
MSPKESQMATADDLDGILDDIGIERGAARDKAKAYCIDRLSDSDGNCLPADDVRVMASSFFDGYSEAMRWR